jgi:hypothetical protein
VICRFASLSTFSERVARGVVNAPSSWLIATLQGGAHEIADWNRVHPVGWWEAPAQLVAGLGVVGIAIALPLEVLAWRQRQAS